MSPGVARRSSATPDVGIGHLSIALLGRGLVGWSAVRALCEAGADVHVTGFPGDPSNSWSGSASTDARVHQHTSDDGWFTGCELCIVAVDLPDPAALLALNARCLELGIALLPGLAMGSVGQVGPLVRGGAGACLRCADVRVRSATGRSCLVSYGPPDAATARLLGQALAARAGEVADSDASRYLTFHRGDGSTTRHPVLRTRYCPDCARHDPQPVYRGRHMFFLSDRRRPNPEHILTLREQLVDPVTGPITSLQVYAAAPGDPPLRHAVAILADEGWQRAGHFAVSCGGSALDAHSAEAAALGEALERASAVRSSHDDLVRASYAEVEAEAVDPCGWELFDPGTRAEPGFPYALPGRDYPITWTWGWSLTRSRPTLIPAARVFLPADPNGTADLADYPLLSGYATANTLEEATLRALLEVVERDAFMIAWANRLSLGRVTFRDADSHVGVSISQFDRTGLEARCGVIELDLGAPVAIAMVRSTRHGDAATVVAAAADMAPERGCERALSELAANRLYVRHVLSEAGGDLPSATDDVRDGRAHGLLFARAEMFDELAFWWESTDTFSLPQRRPRASPSAQLSSLVASIRRAGLEVLVVDLTPPELRELGLSIVKALVPGTYPMNFDARWPQFGGTRITEAPVRAGLRDRALTVDELNRTPHPFP
ncbi:MAG TPA: YcaO-like family protein [Thermoleophilaceae bacterium]